MVERFQSIRKNIETENDIINQIVAGLNKDADKKEEDYKKASRYGKINQYREKATYMQKRDKAILFFQRLLRGRAIQNTMFEGKEKRLALIQELLDVSDTKVLKLEEKKAFLKQNHEEIAKDAILEAIQGDVITKTLDILAKELIRFKHEKKISAYVKLAEEERRNREIVE